MAEPIGVAVVGLNTGKAHLWAYAQLPDRYWVVAVCHLDAGRAERAAARNPAAVALTDLAAACAHPERRRRRPLHTARPAPRRPRTATRGGPTS